MQNKNSASIDKSSQVALVLYSIHIHRLLAQVSEEREFFYSKSIERPRRPTQASRI
uniref:Uncharacterized protein n=1 Tax=Utricularia reniformis TaxID=192314 RepID=A0A1Y0B4F6_9LAMI|nr:hypothetical protein AEK19_MT2115 [Utricularia reniformis]ART32267.1 hypothetical protein AEK19_MT2115 [Utricularia reniformis]